MADAYRHGIYVEEVPTAIIPSVRATTPTVAIGTAPVHLVTNPAAANEPILCYSLNEFVNHFGWSDDFEKYTLCEAAYVHFQLYNVAPVIFVNVLDTAKHLTAKKITVEGVLGALKISAAVNVSTLKVTTGVKPTEAVIIGVTNTEPITIPEKIDAENFSLVSGEITLTPTTDYTVDSGKVTLTTDGLEKVDGALTFISGENTFAELVRGVDYTAAYNSDGVLILTVVSVEKVVDDKIEVSYSEIDADAVTAADIIGGVDIVSGKNTGLELIEEIFPRFGMVPGQIIAPKFSKQSVVAGIMHAKAETINGIFKGMAIADIPTDTMTIYTGITGVKNGKNFADRYLLATWPKTSLAGIETYLSTHMAALICKVDADHDNIPYKSPSNEKLQCDSTILDNGDDVFLGRSQANYLNGQGVVTALNFNGGWCSWGNRTSAYPGETDPKDSFIACRRMTNFICNTLTLTFWSKIDDPMNKRLVEHLVDSANRYLAGLVSVGALLGGRVEFLESENPMTDLIDGKMTFHIYLGLPIPAREIDFKVEYDPSYLANLFTA